MDNVVDCQRNREMNESQNKMSPSAKSQLSSRRANERVKATAISSPKDVKLSLKENEPQVSQRYKNMEINENPTTLLFSLNGGSSWGKIYRR
jgi:hypothetical protein